MTGMTFHHVSLITGSRELAETCERFYKENFGMLLAYSVVSETNDFIFLADNVNPAGMPFEIIGKTAEEREEAFLKKHGPGLDHLCFTVDDVRKAYKDLAVAGVPFHISPYEFRGSFIAWCKDPAGVEIELLQIIADIPEPEVESQIPKAQYNHVSIAVEGRQLAQKTEDFYREHFGMKEILRGGPSEDMDWVYLADANGANPLWLEIVRAIYENEKTFIAKHGSGLEHHCFVVEDAKSYYKWLKDKGVTIQSELIEFAGAKMFYLRDPAEVLIQVLQMPEDLP